MGLKLWTKYLRLHKLPKIFCVYCILVINYPCVLLLTHITLNIGSHWLNAVINEDDDENEHTSRR